MVTKYCGFVFSSLHISCLFKTSSVSKGNISGYSNSVYLLKTKQQNLKTKNTHTHIQNNNKMYKTQNIYYLNGCMNFKTKTKQKTHELLRDYLI